MSIVFEKKIIENDTTYIFKLSSENITLFDIIQRLRLGVMGQVLMKEYL